MSDSQGTSSPPPPPPAEKKYALSMFPRKIPVHPEYADKVIHLQEKLGRKVLVLVDEYNPPPFRVFDQNAYAYRQLRRYKDQLPKEPIAVLLDSWGGSAMTAFKLATLIRRRCGSYCAVVPEYALSAATLFALGADSIYLGDDAVLGPLDAQLFDHDVEEDWVSALDTVQAVEQLDGLAIEVALKMLKYLQDRTNKKRNLLLRHALRFAVEITHPLFNKIDAIRYSRQSRMLKEAQDYAERLLQPKFEKEQAEAIARDLVRRYATHDFVIDREESKSIGMLQEEGREGRTVGLHVKRDLSADLESLLDWFAININRTWGLGFVEETAPSTETANGQ